MAKVSASTYKYRIDNHKRLLQLSTNSAHCLDNLDSRRTQKESVRNSENFKIHSVAWIGLGIQIRPPQFSACNSKVEFKDKMEFKYSDWYTSFCRSDSLDLQSPQARACVLGTLPGIKPYYKDHRFIGDTITFTIPSYFGDNLP